VEHGRVGKQLLVLLGGEERARQQAPGLSGLLALHLCIQSKTRPTYKLALLDHGRQDQLGAANALVKRPPMQLWRLCRLNHPCRLCLDRVRERERRDAQYCWPKQSCQEHGQLDSCTSIRNLPQSQISPTCEPSATPVGPTNLKPLFHKPPPMNFIHRDFLSSEVFQRHDEFTNHLQLYLSHFLLVTLATFSACSTLYNCHNQFSLRQTTPIFFRPQLHHKSLYRALYASNNHAISPSCILEENPCFLPSFHRDTSIQVLACYYRFELAPVPNSD
jgi:hypothetical protein